MKTLLVLLGFAFVLFAPLQIEAIRVSNIQHRMKPKRHLLSEPENDDQLPQNRYVRPDHPFPKHNNDDEIPEFKTESKADHNINEDDDANESFGEDTDDPSSKTHHYFFKHNSGNNTPPN